MKKRIIALMLLAVALCCFGCGKKDKTDEPVKEALSPSGKAAYYKALEDILNKGLLPGGEKLPIGTGEDIGKSQFALGDVNKDGRDELILLLNSEYSAGNSALIYLWEDEGGEMKKLLGEYPMLTFYDNGIIKVGFSHNQGLSGDNFWPFSIYQFDAASGIYVKEGSVEAWDKNFVPEGFPEDIDKSKTGYVYYITPANADKSNPPVDEAEYMIWYDSYLKGAKEVSFDFMKITSGNIEKLK